MFRIRDLLAVKTLIESETGREVFAYFKQNHRRGYSEWRIQYYSNKGQIWNDVPANILRAWADGKLLDKKVPKDQ